MPWLPGMLAGMSAAIVRVDAGPASTSARVLLKTLAMFATVASSAASRALMVRGAGGPFCAGERRVVDGALRSGGGWPEVKPDRWWTQPPAEVVARERCHSAPHRPRKTKKDPRDRVARRPSKMRRISSLLSARLSPTLEILACSSDM